MIDTIIDVKAKAIQDYYNVDGLSDQFFIIDSSSQEIEGRRQTTTTDFPARLDIIMIILCEEGWLNMTLGYDNYTIRKNDFMHILPKSVFQVIGVSPDFRARTICIQPDFFDFRVERLTFDIYNVLRESPCHTLPPSKMELVTFLLNYIKEIIQDKNNTLRKEIVHNALSIMFYETSNLLLSEDAGQQKGTSNSGEDILRKFLKEIEMSYHKERSVQYYAGKAFLTPKYFASLIHRLTGKRAKDWIDGYTVMAAKAMLKSSYLTIQQISYELNFATPSHFGRYFKHHTGISPLQYRKN